MRYDRSMKNLLSEIPIIFRIVIFYKNLYEIYKTYAERIKFVICAKNLEHLRNIYDFHIQSLAPC